MFAKESMDYGLDAPGHLMRFLTMAVATAAAAIIFGATEFWIFSLIAGALCAWWTFWAAAWIAGSMFGKLRARDAIISRIAWRGDERVLDVGCGHGLLLVAAAKKLTTGLAIGIDIWSQVGQWDNHAENTARNARIEGVADRVEICDGDASKLEFPDESFDVVVSSVALHNIPEKVERDQAIREIIRVLKPGGQVAIYDINCVPEYQQIFLESGMEHVQFTEQLFWHMPQVSLLTAIKHLRSNNS